MFKVGSGDDAEEEIRAVRHMDAFLGAFTTESTKTSKQPKRQQRAAPLTAEYLEELPTLDEIRKLCTVRRGVGKLNAGVLSHWPLTRRGDTQFAAAKAS